MFFFHRSGVVSDFPGFVVVVVVKKTPKTETNVEQFLL